MSTSAHPSAPHHLPLFLPGADGSDPVLIGTAIFLLVLVIAFGVFFLWLHSLPERIAHRTHKLQFQVVAVLCLIALFTHIHAFWIAGLLLAVIDVPDFLAPLRRIADSAEKIAGLPTAADYSVERDVPAGQAVAEEPTPLKPEDRPLSPHVAQPTPVKVA